MEIMNGHHLFSYGKLPWHFDVQSHLADRHEHLFVLQWHRLNLI